jgi:ppGpp synthetase/RelA/SpoT-type nucleotidyltranferase
MTYPDLGDSRRLTPARARSLYRSWLDGIIGWNTLMATAAIDGPQFPGGSKERVNRAGDAVRGGNPSPEDLEVINTWRAAHRAVLNTFQAILRNRTRGKKIIVAQRHKRRSTIFDKLMRLPGMRLARMDDVAGCRLIFQDTEALYAFRKKLHQAHFNHQLKNEPDKYDYMKHPKSTGYRGVHDVYSYDANSEHGKPYKGLLVELQYRTIYQHAWATAVEVIGLITESQPKFQKGDKRYEEAMSYASEIIARAYEDSNSCHPDLSAEDVVAKFLEYDHDLGLLNLLRALNTTNREVSEKRNVILILNPDGKIDDLETITFRDATDALRALFRLEAENPGKDVVLVRADTSEDVRIAFKNYFSDAKEFIQLIENGCHKLVGKRVVG